MREVRIIDGAVVTLSAPHDLAGVRYVRIADELLPTMREWSPPVSFRVVGDEAGVLRLQFRAAAHEVGDA